MSAALMWMLTTNALAENRGPCVEFAANALVENRWLCVELTAEHLFVDGKRLQDSAAFSTILDASEQPWVMLVVDCSSNMQLLERVWSALHRDGQTKGYLYADAAAGQISPWLPACLREDQPKRWPLSWNERLT